MRKMFVVAILVLSSSLGACSTCKLEKQAVGQLEKNHEHIFTRYLGYVGRDPALSDKAKQTEVLLVEETRGTVQRLKKRTEE